VTFEQAERETDRAAMSTSARVMGNDRLRRSGLPIVSDVVDTENCCVV